MFKSLKLILPPITVILLLAAAVSGCGSSGGATANGNGSSQQAQTQPQTESQGQPQTQVQSPAQTQTVVTTGLASEQPVAQEKNPVGDIPDSQVFIKYSSAEGGYALEAPEGWARTEKGSNVSFIDKLDGFKVTMSQVQTQPTVDSVRSATVAELKKTGRAVQVQEIKGVSLPGGKAVLIKYQSNSDPDAVTGKKVRLEDNSYLFYNKGKLATLTFWAPLGADNVDQWKRMSESFRWK